MNPAAGKRRARALCGGGLVLAAFAAARGYALNSSPAFYTALIALAALAGAAIPLWKRSPSVATLCLTLILSVGGLIALEWTAAPAIEAPLPLPPPRDTLDVADRPFSFRAAQDRPADFERWWNFYVREWSKLKHRIQIPDPAGRRPFKLKPSSSVRFFDSVIRINRLGFRGPEISAQKGDRYRIVALGESTTMGATIQSSDRPWPEILEDLLNDQLDTPRRIEVINAGVAAYTLEDGIARLKEDVLPLEPDLLISYHGYNGLEFLDPDLAPVRHEARPPHFIERPSHFLARAEHVVRLFLYRQNRYRREPDPGYFERLDATADDSRYARLYQELIEIARLRQSPLVLVSFNMAVNSDSEEDVVRFYSAGFPEVRSAITANRVHTRLLRRLAEEHDQVFFVDASTHLDGANSAFIDLVHFTQEGRALLAANVANGILELVQTELGLSEARRIGKAVK